MTDHDETESRRRAHDSEQYLASFDPATESPSTRLYEAIEEMDGVDLDRLPPLGEEIDPGALNALLSPRGDGDRRRSLSHVQFDYGRYTVDVDSDGMILVSGPRGGR